MQAKEIIKFYHFGKLELNKLIACQRNAKLYTVQGVVTGRLHAILSGASN
jgi:hypothetical protein